jgi:hypothetical protein
LRNKDLIVVLKQNDDLVVADEARLKFYEPDWKRDRRDYQTTIEFMIDGVWYETSPIDPGYNINLNYGDAGGIYMTTDALVEFPDDPVDAFFFHPKK